MFFRFHICEFYIRHVMAFVRVYARKPYVFWCKELWRALFCVLLVSALLCAFMANTYVYWHVRMCVCKSTCIVACLYDDIKLARGFISTDKQETGLPAPV
jgi:hypothetical protein